ncbi:hypothetical protein NQ314_015295 [Rhamnusium bicolor]|uniref:ethanolamine kinase n=1 Tax=Rhamnusium bicolor TaxID=1586634 RepID=A0AAV8WYF1_9CUCU|nr:hypothetical protein NQ314_015295 [Rhamnusium bicolor]
MGEKSTCVPHIKLVVDENFIQEGALKILERIRPTWEKDSIKCKLLTDGITNKLVGCKPADAEESETVLVRVYGNKTDLLIDRKAETRNIILLNSVDLAPNLYATFENGLAYRFIPGCTLNESTVRDPNIYKLVATRMAKLHKVRAEGAGQPKAILYHSVVTPKAKIEEEIKQVRNVMEILGSPVVFAHNDLLLGNVIFTESENSVTFIDFEYAAFNYQAFDIGNHFAEFVGLGLDIDYCKYPEKELQLDWLTTYLTEFNGKYPTEMEVENLYVEVNKFVLMSHLFWGLWALIQAEHSYIDFDFMGYAVIRFSEYFAKKEVFLSLRTSS